MLEYISTPDAPAAIGPYSQAIKADRFLFASGCIAIDPATGEIDGDTITQQSERVMSNVRAVLAGAGYEVSDVVKTSCFLADMADFAAFNEVYGACFTHKPARSCVAVRELPKGVLVEVEVIAYR